MIEVATLLVWRRYERSEQPEERIPDNDGVEGLSDEVGDEGHVTSDVRFLVSFLFCW